MMLLYIGLFSFSVFVFDDAFAEVTIQDGTFDIYGYMSTNYYNIGDQIYFANHESVDLEIITSLGNGTATAGNSFMIIPTQCGDISFTIVGMGSGVITVCQETPEISITGDIDNLVLEVYADSWAGCSEQVHWFITPDSGNLYDIQKGSNTEEFFTNPNESLFYDVEYDRSYRVDAEFCGIEANPFTRFAPESPEPQDGPFVLPCSMQENGDGVSASSCNGFYSNGIARAEVGIHYHTGLFPIEDYEAVGFFLDEDGNQGSNLNVVLDEINPNEQLTLIFENNQAGFVSEFQMQMLGGELVVEEPEPDVDEYSLGFKTDGIDILDAKTDDDFNSLILDVNVKISLGILEITIPRGLLDAQFQGSDNNFVVVADGDEPDFEEIATTSDSRTLRIELPVGTEEVEIVGTEINGVIANSFPVYDNGLATGGIEEEPEVPDDDSEPINVYTDRTSYDLGDDIEIFGTVNEILSGFLVEIQVIASNGNLVTVQQLEVDSNKTFETELTVGGPLWKSTGSYTVKAKYSTESRTDETTFWFNGEEEEEPEFEILSLTTSRTSYRSGDVVVISGQATDGDFDTPITIQIFNGGSLLEIAQLSIASDGRFTHTFITEGPLWQESGKHTVRATYGSDIKETDYVFRSSSSDSDDGPQTANVSVPAGTSVPGCEDANECYLPFEVRIANDGEVTWSNDDTAAHTVTSGTPEGGPDGNFDSSLFMAGNTYSVNFQNFAQGDYPYFCMVHPWMTGIVIVGQGGSNPPPPVPDPEPEPELDVDLDVFVNKSVFDLGDIVQIDVNLDGITDEENVAIDVTDPTGTSVVSRTLLVTPDIEEEMEFKIPEHYKTGTYKVTATVSISGKTFSDTTHFKIESQFNQIQIKAVDATDQQGNPSSLSQGETGFVKVVLSANKNIATLITVNLFDSELTSIGIASLKTTLSSGETEMILSFLIPDDAATGSAEIFVNAFSDWPSNGGVPQTSEFATTENIGS